MYMCVCEGKLSKYSDNFPIFIFIHAQSGHGILVDVSFNSNKSIPFTLCALLYTTLYISFSNINTGRCVIIICNALIYMCIFESIC